jgi:hypothetical protein
MAKPVFKKQVIGTLNNNVGGAPMNTFCTVGDFNGDGLPDFVTCGRNGGMAWFENPGKEGLPWKMHVIGEPNHMECGGSAVDLTDNGVMDVINGGDSADDGIYWFENPGLPGVEWKKRIIARTGKGQFHDTIVCEAKNDGGRYLVFTNQHGGTAIYCVPLPKDPTVEPWPELEVVARDKNKPNPHHPWNPAGIQPDEGLAFGDVDGDGKGELVCGTNWFKWDGSGWREHRFTDKYYITAKIAIGDIDGDGKNEIVLSEGDAYIYGYKEGGKLAWFKPNGGITGLWREHIVETGLLDGHTLHLADLCGNGRLDILVGEIGVISGSCEDYTARSPRIMVYENDGAGRFPTRYTIDCGTGTHEAVLADLTNSGRLDLIGKPLHGDEQWNIHAWYNQGGK